MATYAPIKLPPEDFLKLDELVTEGRYPNRTAAVRAAVALLLEQEYERRLEKMLREGYERMPPTEEELALAKAGSRSMATFLRRQQA